MRRPSLTEAAALLEISPGALRLAIDRGEILAHHPFADGPWVISRDILQGEAATRLSKRVKLVFRKFAELGTVRQTLLWFLEHGLEVPTRNSRAETRWKRPVYRSMHRMLTSPVYGGAYSYGKTEHLTGYDSGTARHICKRKPREQWLALIPGAHEGYILWEEFERIQRVVRENNQSGAAKNGQGLLAGLLRCRRCGRKLTVRYTGSGHDVLRYSCIRGWLDNGEPRCIAFGGMTVDAAIGREVLHSQVGHYETNLYSFLRSAIFIRASKRMRNQLALRHSSRSLPWKLSTCPFRMGGRAECD